MLNILLGMCSGWSMKNSPEQDALHKVHLRPITEQEKDLCDQIMSREHPLHSSPSIGRQIHYVAELDGDWVAC